MPSLLRWTKNKHLILNTFLPKYYTSKSLRSLIYTLQNLNHEHNHIKKTLQVCNWDGLEKLVFKDDKQLYYKIE